VLLEMQQRVVRFKLIVPAELVGTQPLNFRLGQQDCRNNKVVKLLIERAKQIVSRQMESLFLYGVDFTSALHSSSATRCKNIRVCDFC